MAGDDAETSRSRAFLTFAVIDRPTAFPKNVEDTLNALQSVFWW